MSICYISNRVNKYNVWPSDCMNFYRFKYDLNGVGLVTNIENGWEKELLDNRTKDTEIKNFTTINYALLWAKELHKTYLSIAS